MRRIAVINQKGGCGKTTSAINLSGILASRGHRTLLVDMDPQSHCAAGLAIPEGRVDLDIGDAMLLREPRSLDKSRLLWRISRNLDLAPSRTKLAGLESARGGLSDMPEKESRLLRVLDVLSGDYQACCIDCSPSIGLLTFNALVASTEILIPVETSYFSLQGAAKQVTAIRSLAKRLGIRCPFWLLPTIHDETSALAKDLLAELRRRYAEHVAPVVIRYDPALKEASSFGQPVIEYNPSSKGAEDYARLADWLISSAAGPEGGEHPRPATVTVVSPMSAQLGLGQKLSGRDDDPPAASRNRSNGGGDAESEFEPDGRGPAVAVADEPGRAPDGSRHAINVAAISRARDVALRARRLVTNQSALAAARIGRPQQAPLEPALRPTTHPSTEPGAESAAALAPRPADQPTPARIVEDLPEAFDTPTAPSPAPGVRQTEMGVLFVAPLSAGKRAAVAGDFNGFSPQAHVMHRDERRGVFCTCIPLMPGRRQYRLVIDGRWSQDPHNPLSEQNPFGERNSVVEVKPLPQPGAMHHDACPPDAAD